jgi:hypothetical protein
MSFNTSFMLQAIGNGLAHIDFERLNGLDGTNNMKQYNTKTKVKKRTNQIIVLKIQSDEMLRPGTGLL